MNLNEYDIRLYCKLRKIGPDDLLSSLVYKNELTKFINGEIMINDFILPTKEQSTQNSDSNTDVVGAVVVGNMISKTLF